jgi:tetratricopeptide (TPR) repeat protein
VYGEDELMKEMTEEFTAKQTSPFQVQATALPWRRIYTTNYDNILETAYGAEGKTLRPVTLDDEIRNTPKDGTLCVHLNGFVGRLSRQNVLSSMKLTDTSYLTASVADSPWATMLRQDLDLAQAVFFIGYSAADLDIRRILFEKDSLRNKSFFAVGRSPDLVTERRAGRFGTVLKMDASDIVDQMTSSKPTRTYPERSEPIPYGLSKYQVEPGTSQPQDRQIFDLLLFGRLKEDFVWKTVHGEGRYCLIRSAAQRALDKIEFGSRAVVFFSGLGNGKTLALELLKCMAADKGYAVYSVVRAGATLLEEIENAMSRPGRKLFTVDNYPDWLDTLKFFGTHGGSDVALALTSRSAAHDLLADRIAEVLATKDIAEIGLDRLLPTEVEELVEYFNEYGLWGDQASWHKSRKRDYIERVCGGHWQAILIKLFESPQMQSRLEALFGTSGEPKYRGVMVAVLILAVLGYPASPDALVDLCGQAILESGFRRDSVMREIIDFSGNEIKLRSAVVAEFLLQRLTDPNLTVQTLVSIAKASDKAGRAQPQYLAIFKSLMRFRNVQNLFPEKDRGRATLQYYESIKNMESTKTNPLFWLQYAIAALVTEDFNRAGKYFDAAYSFAENRDYWDAYQIDNHYARFLLLKAIRSDDVTGAMTAFSEARKLIYGQIVRERLHYPYRVAAMFADFYDTFASRLTPPQRGDIKRAAQYISDRISILPDDRQKQRYVEECWNNMQRILEAEK